MRRYEESVLEVMIANGVTLDEAMQPWLLEVNARPSMDVEHPVPAELAPPDAKIHKGGRGMDGKPHAMVLFCAKLW